MKKLNLLLLLVLLFSILNAGEPIVIKMATVAPEGSSWMNELHAFEKEIAELTDGSLQFRVYPNGVQGDEKNVIRKMKLGQLHAASLTGVGLGEIVPEIRVLELPFLFRTKGEVDYVYNAVFEEIQQRFIEKGFYIVSFAEVGFVYLFANQMIEKPSDLNNLRMWLWKGDPLAETAFKSLDLNAVPLEITDVYTSLQTGLVDGFYISPYAGLALQWFTKADYMLDYPMTHSVGAVVITNSKLNAIPDDVRQIFIDKTRDYLKAIVEQGRKDNIESIKVMEEAGVDIVEVENEALVRMFEKACFETQEELVGKLYSRELLEKVLSLLKEYRAGHDK